MDIKELLKESTKDMLSEENLNKIVEAIDKKAETISESKTQQKVEVALAKQDANYTKMLEKLLVDIDKNHTGKMETLVEAIENKHTKMLEHIVTKYKGLLITEAKEYKENLVTKIDKFFDLVIEEQIPSDQIQEAVDNTRYKLLIEQIGNMIGADKIRNNDLVKEGIEDAKSQIDVLTEQVKTLKKEKNTLIKEKENVDADKLLTEKCKGLPKVKQDYLKRMLVGKNVEFITENFDYTLELFDEKESNDIEKLKSEAQQNSKVISEKIDRNEEEIIQENKTNDPVLDMYMGELNKY